jgi:hypothetical protein
MILTAAAVAGLWFYQPWTMLSPPPPEPMSDGIGSPAGQGAGAIDVDKAIAGRTGHPAASLTPEQQARESGSVQTVLEDLWAAERSKRYHDLYRLFSEGLKGRLRAYYPDTRISNPADYTSWREAGAFEPDIQSMTLPAETDVSAARATAFVDATVIYQGKKQAWEYFYILIKTETGAWRVDGLAAGPQGPARADKSSDMDEDGTPETIAFTGDPLHRVLRWEVIAPDKSQAYVFEMQACEVPPGAGPDHDPYTTVARDPVILAPFTEGERQALAEQLPMWADASEVSFALQSRRPGFLMSNGCVEDPSYFVFWFKGGYREIVF